MDERVDDLVVTGQETETTVLFSLLGAADLFTPGRLEEMTQRFEAVLDLVAADPDMPLDRLRREVSAASAPATPG